MQFNVDPRPVFEHDMSVLGLHARLRWMNGGSKDLQSAKQAIWQICSEQQGDGSWDGSAAVTIARLFELYLLETEANRTTARAIEYLSEMPAKVLSGICGGTYDGMFFRVGSSDRQAMRKLCGLPFTPGCAGFIKTGAAMYFATRFGQGDIGRITRPTNAPNGSVVSGTDGGARLRAAITSCRRWQFIQTIVPARR